MFDFMYNAAMHHRFALVTFKVAWFSKVKTERSVDHFVACHILFVLLRDAGEDKLGCFLVHFLIPQGSAKPLQMFTYLGTDFQRCFS